MSARWFLIRVRKHSLIINILLTILIVWSGYTFIKFINTKNNSFIRIPSARLIKTTTPTDSLLIKKRTALRKLYNDIEYRKQMFDKKVEKLSEKIKQSRVLFFTSNTTTPNFNVHIFYYAWYGNIEQDQKYLHWNHEYIRSWKQEDKDKTYPKDRHEAPLDIGSNYYPSLGCYSSRDGNIIQIHMKQLKNAGVGVLVISWTPPGMKDSPNDILPEIFKHANEQKIKITLHIEPYLNRDPFNLRKHLETFFDTYLDHPAMYKVKAPLSTTPLPVLYVYDSYLTPFSQWKELLSETGSITIRGTKYDAMFIGLLVGIEHRYHIKKSYFDGFYTYFASNGFSYGSSWKNWNSLAKYARQNALLFIPSIGPGYIDTQVRPWNSANTRHRRHGGYYDVGWRSAIGSKVSFVSITSFNEWHEGTQIEPAVTKTVNDFTYLDYEPEGPNFYLNLTKWWVNQFSKHDTHNRV